MSRIYSKGSLDQVKKEMLYFVVHMQRHQPDLLEIVANKDNNFYAGF